jgi:plasmid stabilization system protein ParE
VKDLRRQVRSLQTLPERFEIIPEAAQTGDAHRHLPFGNYRIIYRVEAKRVLILRILHAARLLDPSMLPQE